MHSPKLAAYSRCARVGTSAGVDAERVVEATVKRFLGMSLWFSPSRGSSHHRRHAAESDQLAVAVENID